MKKIFVSAALMAGFITAANAQMQVAEKPIEVHVKGGVALADQNVKFNNTTVSTDARLGYMGEVGLNARLGRGFSIQPAVALQGLGFKSTSTDARVVNTVLAVPVTLRYNVANSGFNIYAGPQLGFLLNTKLKTDNSETDVADQYKKTDVAALVGAEFNIPTTRLLVGGRYQAGLTDLDNSNTNGSSRRQNAGYFYLGYRF